MPTSSKNSLIPRLAALACCLAVLLSAGSAFAIGRIQWDSTRLKENKAGTQSSWRIEMKIFLPKAPDMASVPVKFEFKPVAYYERYLNDGDTTPKQRTVPTPDKQSIIESVDLGFMDPGTGKIENRTRYGFRITRAHGFEAGEYQVTVKDARNGVQIGTTTKLILEGENEVIDRRAMVFAGKDEGEADKKRKEEEEKKKAEQEAQMAQHDDPLAAREDEADWEEEEPEPSVPVEKKKPGACGCRTVSASGSAAGWALPTLLGLALLARRRQRRAA
jgi:MYXO-CTERM domain-containing protein